MRADRFIFYSFMKELHDVFEGLAFEGEQILHNVVIIVVPFQFKAGRIILSRVKWNSDQQGVTRLGRLGRFATKDCAV